MIIFVIFMASYGLSNLYFFLKATAFLKWGLPADIGVGILFLIMAVSPVLVHIYSLRATERAARILSYICYMWVSLLILFLPVALVIDLSNTAARYGTALFGKDISRFAVSPDHAFLLPLLISIALNIYGYFEAKHLRVERLTVKTDKLPAGTEIIRIAQISDVHLGFIVRDKTLNKIIRRVERAQPDLIVSTGDLVDGIVTHIDHLAGRLKTLNARLGKFAVLGNHELYGGLRHSLKFIEDSGFTILRGQGVTVEGVINIAGVDDLEELSRVTKGEAIHEEEREVLSRLPSALFTILLKHQAKVDSASIGLFDLQLSGHTHSGQIFPVSLITPFLFQFHSGFEKLSQGSAIYVSRGAGTAGPPVRFLSPPELTIIDVVSAKETG